MKPANVDRRVILMLECPSHLSDSQVLDRIFDLFHPVPAQPLKLVSMQLDTPGKAGTSILNRYLSRTSN